MNLLTVELGTAAAKLGTAVTSGIAELLPVGIAIMGAMIGVRLIPKVINRFF